MHSYRHATLLGLLLSSLPLHFLVALCGPPDAFAHNSKHKCAVAPLWPSSSILPRITKVWLHPTYDVYNMININIYIKCCAKSIWMCQGRASFYFYISCPKKARQLRAWATLTKRGGEWEGWGGEVQEVRAAKWAAPDAGCGKHNILTCWVADFEHVRFVPRM